MTSSASRRRSSSATRDFSSRPERGPVDRAPETRGRDGVSDCEEAEDEVGDDIPVREVGKSVAERSKEAEIEVTSDEKDVSGHQLPQAVGERALAERYGLELSEYAFPELAEGGRGREATRPPHRLLEVLAQAGAALGEGVNGAKGVVEVSLHVRGGSHCRAKAAGHASRAALGKPRVGCFLSGRRAIRRGKDAQAASPSHVREVIEERWEEMPDGKQDGLRPLAVIASDARAHRGRRPREPAAGLRADGSRRMCERVFSSALV